MIKKITVEVDVPDGTTHYIGNLLDNPTWVKSTQIGVVGDHWWYWTDDKGWVLMSHHFPHWLKKLDD